MISAKSASPDRWRNPRSCCHNQPSTPDSLGYHAALTDQRRNEMGAGRSWTGIPHRAGGAALPSITMAKRDLVSRCGSRWKSLPIPPLPPPTPLLDRTAEDVPNPGTNTVVADGKGGTARYVRVTATQLWKRPTGQAGSLLFRAGPTAGLLRRTECGAQRQSFGQGFGGRMGLVGAVDWSTVGSREKAVDPRVSSSCRPRAGTILPMTWPWSPSPRERSHSRPPDLIELTQSVKDGVLTWDVPDGRVDHPPFWDEKCQVPTIAWRRRAVRGLECDKLSREANQAMFDGMVGRFIKDSPHLAGKTISGHGGGQLGGR